MILLSISRVEDLNNWFSMNQKHKFKIINLKPQTRLNQIKLFSGQKPLNSTYIEPSYHSPRYLLSLESNLPAYKAFFSKESS